MSRPTRPGPAVLGALVAAALFGTAACTTTLDGAPTADQAPAPTEGPGSDPVDWTNRVCGAVLSFARPATSAPDFGRSGDLPAVQREFSGYLDSVVAGARQGGAQLAEAGKAPEAAGDDAVRQASTQMADLQREFAGVKSAVDTVDTADPDAFLKALTKAEAALADITVPNPIGDLTAAPRLQKASERAQQCQELAGLAADLQR